MSHFNNKSLTCNIILRSRGKEDDGFINLSGRLCNWWPMLGQLNRIDPGLVRDENAVNVFDKRLTGAGGEPAKQSEREVAINLFLFVCFLNFLIQTIS